MKRTKTLLLSTLSFLALSLVSINVMAANKNIKFESAYAYTNGDATTYYNGIESSLEGDDLLSALRSLNSRKHQRTIIYKNLMDYFPQTDPGKSSGQVTSFYSGKSANTSQCNKEHVWPNSHGGNLVENDLHMVRPTITSDNSSRGNSFYVEGMNHEYDGWDPANCGDETYRGDSARIIFYCVVANENLSLLDVNKSYTTSQNHDNKMGKLSDLIKWNLEYPVMDREKTRNEAAEKIQGNRNPFIDHPEYVCRIWGKYNSKTKSICDEYEKNRLTGITISEEKKTLKPGESFTLSVSTTPSDLAVELEYVWNSSVSSVASVDSNGLVTALDLGTTLITVYAKGFAFEESCVVSVRNDEEDPPTPPAPTPTPSSSGGCGGDITSTSVILSTLSLLLVGTLLLRKFRKSGNEK